MLRYCLRAAAGGPGGRALPVRLAEGVGSACGAGGMGCGVDQVRGREVARTGAVGCTLTGGVVTDR